MPAILVGLAPLFPGAQAVDRQTVDGASPAAGAYLLALRLAVPLPISRPAPGGVLPGGWYVYAGSARGPGGMRARLRRHLRAEKAIHWHIDPLTCAAAEMAALAIPGESECAIAERLCAQAAFTPAIPGFGSSDCPSCPAHLLRAGP